MHNDCIQDRNINWIENIGKRRIFLKLINEIYIYLFFSFPQNVCISSARFALDYFPAVIARNLPRNFDSEYEYVDFTYLAPPARDNLESLPQTATTLCICAVCQRHRPPFELEILIWKSNRPGTRLRGVGIVLPGSPGSVKTPPCGLVYLKREEEQELAAVQRAAAPIHEITHPALVQSDSFPIFTTAPLKLYAEKSPTSLPLSLFPIRFSSCFLQIPRDHVKAGLLTTEYRYRSIINYHDN